MAELLFIQGVDAEFEVTLHGTTTGENIFKDIAKVDSVQPEVEPAKMCYN